MKQLTESEFLATFAAPMQHVSIDTAPPFDFWSYFEAIPEADFKGHDCSDGFVDHAWTDATGKFQHVLVRSEEKNAFMVLVLDLSNQSVYGHRFLNLNEEYGIDVDARRKPSA